MSKPSLELVLRKVGWEIGSHQLGRFYKIPEEFRTTPADFMGFTATGRAIMIEAKQVQRASLPILKKPGLLPHQWAALLEASRANAIALICWARGDQVATISMDQAISYSAERKSIPWGSIPDQFIHELHGDDPVSILEPFITRSP